MKTKNKLSKQSLKTSLTLSSSKDLVERDNDAPVRHPWQLNFIFDENKLVFPEKILFDDYLCTKGNIINISNWKVSAEVFEIIRNRCSHITHLNLDYCKSFQPEYVKCIRGFKQLRHLSLRGIIEIKDDVAKLFGSLPLLSDLDISENKIHEVALSIMGNSCSHLKKLVLQKCIELTDFGMQFIAQFIQRHRKLQSLDFSGTLSFTDEGALAVLLAAPNILETIDFSYCTQLTSLTFAAFRQRLPALKFVNISNMNLGQSVFEWVSEGCRYIQRLNLSNCVEIDDQAFRFIGRRCKRLRFLRVDNCALLSDIGMELFFKEFEGSLEQFNIDGCIKCGAKTVLAIASRTAALRELHMCGLSFITGESLSVLFAETKELRKLDMNMELKVAVTHRQSVLPHITDESLACARCFQLNELSISGAALVTDNGIISIASICSALTNLNISYCSHLSDKCIVHISKTLPNLLVFNFSGNVFCTNVGIFEVCQNLTKLRKLEFNGCMKITNEGVQEVSRLTELTLLSLRACDSVEDSAIIAIAKSCIKLKSIDISSLDLVSTASIEALATNCLFLTSLNCEGCSFTQREFGSIVNSLCPLSQQDIPRCRLTSRPKEVFKFNQYVLDMKSKDHHARVLQKLCRVICVNQWLRLAYMMRKRAAKQIERAYLRYLRNRFKIRRNWLRRKQNRAAVVLQKFFRRCSAIFLAKRKLNRLRKEFAARLLLQRVVRGHRGRKRCRYLFNRLYRFYSKIGHIVYKKILVSNAQKLRKQVILVQSVVRMFVKRSQFVCAKTGMSRLQQSARNRLKRKVIIRKLLDSMVDYIDVRDRNARFLQKNFRAALFNKNMSPFILVCCIYHRTEYDRNMWNSTIIQRYFRGFHVRLIRRRIRERPFLENRSAISIQKAFRAYCARRLLKRLRWKKKRARYRWVKLFCARPALRIGIIAKRIQRAYRRYRFLQIRDFLAVSMQKMLRGWHGRERARVHRENRMNRCAKVITRVVRLRRARLMRKARMALEHMAAYRIQRKFKKSFDGDAKKRILAAVFARKRKEEVVEKTRLLLAKRTKCVNKLRDMLTNMYASRIQRFYRKWKKEKMKRQQAIINRKRAEEEAKEEIFEIQSRRFMHTMAFNPWKLVNDFAWYVKNNLSSHGLDNSIEDINRFQNAILVNQTQTMVHEGIVEIHLTLGPAEKKAFHHSQEVNRHGKLPYYSMLPEDISGRMGLELHLWVMHGTGKECICELEVDAKPQGYSFTGLRTRQDKMRGKGIKLAWHPDVHIEFRGHCTIKQGNGGYGLQDVQIALNEDVSPFMTYYIIYYMYIYLIHIYVYVYITFVMYVFQAGEDLKQRGYVLVKNLHKLGFFSSVWSINRAPLEDPDLFDLGTLNVRPWVTAKLIKLVKGFNMTEMDIMMLRQTFEAVLGIQISENIRQKDFFVHIDYPFTQIVKWIIATVKPKTKGELSFSEYVHMICFYCMFGRREMLKFLFGSMDVAGNQYLNKEQFETFMEHLGEESSYHIAGWKRQYANYEDKKLKYLFLDGFDRCTASNPGMLWMPQLLQKKFRASNLGESYWEKKMNQFRIIRENMGIKISD